MKSFLFLLLAASSLFGSEKLLGSVEGVDIITKDLFTNKGRYYGNRFYARNTEAVQANVLIKVTKGKNVKDTLSVIPLAVPAKGETLFGDVVQDNPAEAWEWYVDWTITR